MFTDIINENWKGYTDTEKVDTIYQADIKGIERSYPSCVSDLSSSTEIPAPFNTNLFQALISDEADKRYKNAFYATNESKRINEDEDTLKTEQDVCDFLAEVLYDQEGISYTRSFEDAGLLTGNTGIVIVCDNGSEYQLSIVKSR